MPEANAQPNDPSEELKMDKDLGLFEMINAGDFATVSANPGAAQSDAAASNAGQQFDFNAANHENNMKQNVEG